MLHPPTPCKQTIFTGSPAAAGLCSGPRPSLQTKPRPSTHPALLLAGILEDLSLQCVALGLAVDGQHASDGLAHHLNLRQLVGCSASDLGDTQGAQFALQLLELVHQLLLVLATQLMGLDAGWKAVERKEGWMGRVGRGCRVSRQQNAIAKAKDNWMRWPRNACPEPLHGCEGQAHHAGLVQLCTATVVHAQVCALSPLQVSHHSRHAMTDRGLAGQEHVRAVWVPMGLQAGCRNHKDGQRNSPIVKGKKQAKKKRDPCANTA
eukprot:738992-Pelagomonas_calceolata.AAC.5